MHTPHSSKQLRGTSALCLGQSTSTRVESEQLYARPCHSLYMITWKCSNALTPIPCFLILEGRQQHPSLQKTNAAFQLPQNKWTRISPSGTACVDDVSILCLEVPLHVLCLANQRCVQCGCIVLLQSPAERTRRIGTGFQVLVFLLVLD